MFRAASYSARGDNELKVVHGSVHGRGIYTAGLQNPRQCRVIGSAIPES